MRQNYVEREKKQERVKKGEWKHNWLYEYL